MWEWIALIMIVGYFFEKALDNELRTLKTRLATLEAAADDNEDNAKEEL